MGHLKESRLLIALMHQTQPAERASPYVRFFNGLGVVKGGNPESRMPNETLRLTELLPVASIVVRHPVSSDFRLGLAIGSGPSGTRNSHLFQPVLRQEAAA